MKTIRPGDSLYLKAKVIRITSNGRYEARLEGVAAIILSTPDLENLVTQVNQEIHPGDRVRLRVEHDQYFYTKEGTVLGGPVTQTAVQLDSPLGKKQVFVQDQYTMERI